MLLFRKILDALNAFSNRAGDGIDTTEYVEAIEGHFNIHIEIPVLESLETLGDLCDEIARLTNTATDEERARIWIAERRITGEEMGLDQSELQKETRFVEDLCC